MSEKNSNGWGRWHTLVLTIGLMLCLASAGQALQVVAMEANFGSGLEMALFPANSSFPVTIWLKREANDPPGQSVTVRLYTTDDYPAIDLRQTLHLSDEKTTAIHFSVHCPALPSAYPNQEQKLRIEVTDSARHTLIAEKEAPLLMDTNRQNLRYLEVYRKAPPSFNGHDSGDYDLGKKNGQEYLWSSYEFGCENLPETASGYGTTAAVALQGDPDKHGVAFLTRNQWKALSGFVSSGGLVIFPDPRILKWLAALSSEPFLPGHPLMDLVPVTGTRLTRYGRGGILACAPNAFKGYGRDRGESRKLLIETDALLHSGQFSPIARLKSFGQDNYIGSLEDALAGSIAGKVPPFGAVAGFLFVYVGLLIPVSYFLLKKFDRRELAWVTVPLLAIQFSGVAYLLGRALKSSPITANRFSVYETSANRTGEFSAYGQFSLYSDRRGKLDLTTPALAQFPVASSYEAVRTPPKFVLDQTDGEGGKILGFPVRQWQSHRFELDLPPIALAGQSVLARLTRKGETVHLALTNRTGHTLKHGVVTLGNYRVPVSDLKPGQQTTLDIKWAIFKDGNDPSADGISDRYHVINLQTPDNTSQTLENALVASLNSDSPYGENAKNELRPRSLAYLAFFDGSPFPVTANGKPVPGASTNLLYVHLDKLDTLKLRTEAKN